MPGAVTSTTRLSLTLLLGLLPAILCGQASPKPDPSAQAHGSQTPAATAQQTAGAEAGLPVNFERHTGDLDEMVKRGSIRALVFYSRSGFFYVNGQPAGVVSSSNPL